MAQLVEQLIRNQQVAGSSPASSSRGDAAFRRLLFYSLYGLYGICPQIVFAPVAQGIEHSPPKRRVGGSNPLRDVLQLWDDLDINLSHSIF